MEIYMLIIIAISLVGINLYWAINTNRPVYRYLGITIVLMAGILSCYFVIHTENFNSFNGLFYVLVFVAVCLISIAIFSFYLASRVTYRAEKSKEGFSVNEHNNANGPNDDKRESNRALAMDYGGEAGPGTSYVRNGSQMDCEINKKNTEKIRPNIILKAIDSVDDESTQKNKSKKSEEIQADGKQQRRDSILRPISMGKKDMRLGTVRSLSSTGEKTKAGTGKRMVVLNNSKGVDSEPVKAASVDSVGLEKRDDFVAAPTQDQVNPSVVSTQDQIDEKAIHKRHHFAIEPDDRENISPTEELTKNPKDIEMSAQRNTNINQKQAQDGVEAGNAGKPNHESAQDEQVNLPQEKAEQREDQQQIQSRETKTFSQDRESEQKVEENLNEDTALSPIEDKQKAIIAKAAVFVKEARYLLAQRLISSLSNNMGESAKTQADLICLECLVGLKEYAQAQEKLFVMLKKKDHFGVDEKNRLKETMMKLKSMGR